MNKSEDQLVRKATISDSEFSISGDAPPKQKKYMDKTAIDNTVKMNLQLAKQRESDPGTSDRYRVELEEKSRSIFVSSVIVGLVCAIAYKFVELRKL